MGLKLIFEIILHISGLIVLLGATTLAVLSLIDLIDVDVKWKGFWWLKKRREYFPGILKQIENSNFEYYKDLNEEELKEYINEIVDHNESKKIR